MTKKLPNLIAAEDAVAYQTWSLPEVGGDHNVPASVRKARALIERRRSETLAKHVAATAPDTTDRDTTSRDTTAPGTTAPPACPATSKVEGEIIEDVSDADSLGLSPITAEHLQEITEAAEREGYAEGHEKGFQQGQAEGYQKGYERGEAEAREAATTALSAQTQQLLQVAESLVHPIAEQEQQLRQLLLEYVTNLTRQVIERELLLDSSHILAVVEQAIQALPVGTDQIKIYLNPADLQVVETYAEAGDKPWAFHACDELLPGGCRIESRQSLVDFSVESRLQAIFEQFLDKQLAVTTSQAEENSIEAKDSEAGREDGQE